VIVRILGEGQLDVPPEEVESLNLLDERLQDAVEQGDEPAFRQALSTLLTRVREVGEPVPADTLAPSELVLPRADSDLDEVRELLGDEGLIPG
jgi:hypothetical protein